MKLTACQIAQAIDNADMDHEIVARMEAEKDIRHVMVFPWSRDRVARWRVPNWIEEKWLETT